MTGLEPGTNFPNFRTFERHGILFCPENKDVVLFPTRIGGTFAALHRRGLTGDGSTIDASLFETALSWVNMHVASYLASGKVPGRRGSEATGMVPYKVFEASDGYVMIAAGNDNLFRRLAGACGHPEWLDDPHFASNPERVRNRDLVHGSVQAVVAGRSCADWLAVLEKVAALNAERILPDHSAPGDGSLVADERALISEIRTRALALKSQSVSADDAGKQISADLKAKHPDWSNTNAAGFVKSVYAEVP